MDWKYILSLSPDSLNEDEKDQLYSLTAWFDYDSEKLDESKYVALLKIMQEIMKYKAEQVEVLLAELDEIAARHGEEEVRRQESFDDLQSVKSKKSQASTEHVDLEQKYKELKSKFKQQVKNNETQKRDIEKLKQDISSLREEKSHLQSELQAMLNHADESHSDLSESVTDQHKELVHVVQQKNKQISQLLSDIENIESENHNLREKMSNIRDELYDATNQVTKMTSELTSLKAKLDDSLDISQTLKEENEALRNQIQDCTEEKRQRDIQMDQFTLAVDSRVDEWKKALCEKEAEIEELRLQIQRGSVRSSESSSSAGGDKPYEEALNKIIAEREEQLAELQRQLQSATNEMDKSTRALQHLSADKNAALCKIDELVSLVRDLKAQLRAAHERCQELQSGIDYAESIAESRQEDIDEIVHKLKDDGEVQLAESLEQVQKLRGHLRVKDKQIAEYVKIANKLQKSVEQFETENIALRDKCGIPEDEDVDIAGVLIKRRKHSKDIVKYEKRLLVFDNENLNLKSENQRLKRKISILSNQVLNFGGNPYVDGELKDDSRTIEEHSNEQSKESKQQYVDVLEENEALRKGLHEILESVRNRKETGKREIKSETLEKLLKALDARHVSGWYHPAMRLQAELHTLQGVNNELREQLRIVRLELDTYKKEYQRNHLTVTPNYKVTDIKDFPNTIKDISSSNEAISNLNNHLLSVINSYNEEEATNKNLIENLEKYKNKFEVVERQMNIIYTQYITEKENWETKQNTYVADKSTLEERVAVLEAKLKEFSNLNESAYKRSERLAEMSANMVVLNRKCVFLENEESKLSAEVRKLEANLADAEAATNNKISQLSIEKNDLLKKILVLENQTSNTVSRETFTEMQNRLDSITVKYRNLLRNFNYIKSDHSNEVAELREVEKMLLEEKSELQNRFLSALANLHVQESVSLNSDEEGVAKKLAQTEINEIAEKQRANHMTNLYGLVKEQLQKSEQHLQEYEKYNEEILRCNIALQESVKYLEDKLTTCVDTEVHKQVEIKCMKSAEEIQSLTLENEKLKHELMVAKTSATGSSTSVTSNDLEILNLKHQILDLQASGDDKALIARLSSDVVLARLSESQCHKKLEDLELELKENQHKYDTCKSMLQQEKTEKEAINGRLQNKIRILEQIILRQRQHYLGSSPLISEEIFNTYLQEVLKDKQTAFALLRKTQEKENECTILKDQLNKQISLEADFKANLKDNVNNVLEKIKCWNDERNAILLKELKYKREMEFKNMQLEQLSYKLDSQDELITKLQEELLRCYQKYDQIVEDENTIVKADEIKVAHFQDKKLQRQQETQTTPELLKSFSDEASVGLVVANSQARVSSSSDEIKERDEAINQLKSKITELEMNVSLFRTQIGDKQSQITFYEKHILELQSKISKFYSESSNVGYSTDVVQAQTNSEEVIAMKDSLKKLQEMNLEKDNSILEYQTLLKKDRDEHSLAAARMQQEMKKLQEMIAVQEKSYKQLKESSFQHPGRAAIEQYILQVHALEKHTADLHTTVSTLNSQLQASRQEAVRWQTLADERLDSMDQLRSDLEEQHKNEIATYKRESEKWREEILKLNELISKHRSETSYLEPDFNRKLKEKDDKIHELSTKLMHFRMDIKKHSDKSDSLMTPKLNELESINDQLSKDYEVLKKRYEQVLNRERSAKEEIYNLKEQLLKRPLSARSEKTDKELQLQKKVTILEKEVDELKSKLEKQIVINEAHKVAVADNFEKWRKQKHWQQLSEKLKTKLHEKTEEFDKLHQTCAGYKILIERLEREKHSLESKIRNLRNSSATANGQQVEFLNLENEKLRYEMQALVAKLQMQQEQPGALGTAILEDKLKAQEKKIALLELTSKGNIEIRSELERLQNTNESLQKINLRLEAENLDLKLDLEKYGKDAPHLREQIQHLENYIEVLKTEHQTKQADTGDQTPIKSDKKMVELEKTIFVLKRIVEKLQVENKRLRGGSTRDCSSIERLSSADKIRTDYMHLKQQYGESVQQVARLEDQLKTASSRIAILEKRSVAAQNAALTDELAHVTNELSYKTELLDKVKVLLHRAAGKEKALLDEIASLRVKIPLDVQSPEGSSM